MKQRVTPEDINKMGKRKQAKLLQYCLDKKLLEGVENEWFRNWDYKWLVWLPMFTIGEMIEFLDDHEYFSSSCPHKGISWKQNEELADMLWRYCKEVL